MDDGWLSEVVIIFDKNDNFRDKILSIMGLLPGGFVAVENKNALATLVDAQGDQFLALRMVEEVIRKANIDTTSVVNIFVSRSLVQKSDEESYRIAKIINDYCKELEI